MEKTYQMSGYLLHLIPTKKFKTTTISLRMHRPLVKEEATLRSLLTFVLIAATRKLPSSQLLAQQLDENYGASLSAHISAKGKAHVLNITTSFVNDVYLPTQEKLLEKQLQLLSDLLFDPLIKDEGFDEEIVNIKKKEVYERLQASKDDKMSYALDQLLHFMGINQTLGISSTGYEEDLSKITPQDLYTYFKKCLLEDEKHIYIIGDIDESIIPLLKKHLSFSPTLHHYESSYMFTSTHQDSYEFIERQDITQSKLNLGYTIDCDFQSPKHYAMTLFNALFGGFSQSRLFKVVREQHSLCYYIHSSYAAFSGIMVVSAGIDQDRYEQCKELIANELQDIQNGNISDDELKVAKILLKNNLLKSKDEASSMMSLAYNRDLVDKEETLEQYIDKLLNVSKDDIVDVAKSIRLDTLFFLTGKDAYGDN